MHLGAPLKASFYANLLLTLRTFINIMSFSMRKWSKKYGWLIWCSENDIHPTENFPIRMFVFSCLFRHQYEIVKWNSRMNLCDILCTFLFSQPAQELLVNCWVSAKFQHLRSNFFKQQWSTAWSIYDLKNGY